MLTRSIAARMRIIFLAVLGISSIAVAGGWGSTVTIAGYYVYDGGSAYITTSGNTNPDGCSSSHYLYINTETPHFKEIWAQVLTAHTTGSTSSETSTSSTHAR